MRRTYRRNAAVARTMGWVFIALGLACLALLFATDVWTWLISAVVFPIGGFVNFKTARTYDELSQMWDGL